jgi:hypothetical protein
MARWDRIRARGNVEDRRGMGTGAKVGGGVGGLGIIGILLVLLFGGGGGLEDMVNQLDNVQAQPQTDVQPEEFQGVDDYEEFASTVLGSNDEVWSEIFVANDLTYREPTLVLFRDETTSECGGANSQVGPHYCPNDETIYLDETFFDVLTRQFGAQGGDVAEAYVISHEVGHHVQKVLGIMGEVQRRQQGAGSQEEGNQWSVLLELQADCLAGVWGHEADRARSLLEHGDVEEALGAASAIGDDRLQRESGGYVRPDSFTHGSSAERVRWFRRGFETGDVEACDTFAG